MAKKKYKFLASKGRCKPYNIKGLKWSCGECKYSRNKNQDAIISTGGWLSVSLCQECLDKRISTLQKEITVRQEIIDEWQSVLRARPIKLRKSKALA